MFVCPVCGNNSCSEVLSGMFECDKCSVLFSDPSKFGNINSKQKKQDTKFNHEQAHIYPNNVGGIVSAPIKLRRN